MTDRADLTIKLTPPAAARPEAVAVIAGVEANIQAQILLLATNGKSSDPDLVGWLRNQGMLSAEGLDASKPEAVMADDYREHLGEIEDETGRIRKNNKSVESATFRSFDTADRTFESIMSKVDTLQEEMDAAPGASEGEQYMPRDAEAAVVGKALRTLDDVIGLVDDAQSDIEAYAGDIERASPGNNGNPAQIWGATSPQSKMTFTVTGDATRDSILGIAREELGRGVAERGGSSNNAYYLDTKERTPYDIGDAWCAAFTSYVWEKAGYQVDWTNPNYVPAIWNDAKAKLDTATADQAEPGDLIIFDWQGDGRPDHIGIVDSVNGTTITTIEGNSSDRLRSNTYQMGNNDLVGVVKPPTDKTGSRM